MMVTTLILSSIMKLSFAQWFKLRRNIADVTQAQIAKALDVRPQTVSNWEKGVSKPSLNPEQTLKLCSILKISLEDLAKGFRGEIVVDD
jgi:DNA-binding XRE family transcriptional regulator